MLTTLTPSAVGPTPNYFESNYFGWRIFADLLKEIFSELIESILFAGNEVDSLCTYEEKQTVRLIPD